MDQAQLEDTFGPMQGMTWNGEKIAVKTKRDRWPSVPIRASVHGHEAALEINMMCPVTDDDRMLHVEEALKTPFPILKGPGPVIVDDPCYVVASGPSAVTMLPEIRAHYDRGGEIIAIKGAHDWLIDNGIVPRAAIAIDPQQSRAKCFKRLRDDVLYICATQMHPDAWKHLANRRVLLFHSRVRVDQEKLPGWENRYIVPCTSTTGNTALILLYIFGRRNVELYGFDSCLPEAVTRWQRFVEWVKGPLLKLDGSRVKGKTGTDQVFNVVVANKVFRTTPVLASQAMEIEHLLQIVQGMKVKAHGRGYYQAIIEEGRRIGWPI